MTSSSPLALVQSHGKDFKGIAGNFMGRLFFTGINGQLLMEGGQKKILSTFLLSTWLKVLYMEILGTLIRFHTSLSDSV